MTNRVLVILLLTFSFYNKGLACSCEFTSYEFSFKQYNNASHIFLAKIKEENPQSIVEEIYRSNDLIGFKKGEDFLISTCYTLEVKELFKGDLSNLSHIEQENVTSCSGMNLKEGTWYLFYMYSNEENPTLFNYSACTPIEEIEFKTDSIIPQKKENINSLIQQYNIQILRKLKEVKNDTMTVYFSGYYIENDSLKRESGLVNFRGSFVEGNSTGYWEFFQPKINLFFKKRDNIFKKPIEFGFYEEGKKKGIWSEYYYDETMEKWQLYQEDFRSK